jgi:hypothetical protein
MVTVARERIREAPLGAEKKETEPYLIPEREPDEREPDEEETEPYLIPEREPDEDEPAEPERSAD